MKPLDRAMFNGLYSTEEETEFRWLGCDVCYERIGKRSANSVVKCKGFPDLEHAKANDYYEFFVCGGCLNAYANGEPFPEEDEWLRRN